MTILVSLSGKTSQLFAVSSTDAAAGIVFTYTYRDRIGLVQALACHPLPRMCSLSQGLLSKWRAELINEETPIDRRPLLRSPAQYFNRYSTPIYLAGNNSPNAECIIENARPARAGLLFGAFQNNRGDWLDLRVKRVCLSRDRQSSSSEFGT